jgi:hypothetical protein
MAGDGARVLLPGWMLKVWMVIRGVSAVVLLGLAALIFLALFGVEVF